MVNSVELFKKRMNSAGKNHYDRTMIRKAKEFSDFFRDALNKENCLIDGVSTEAVFQDHSQSNNKDLSDDKYVILPNETKCDVGSYIYWRKSNWLVFTEEFKTIPTHQQLKVKEVNENIKWIDEKGNICNDGLGWGAYVQNQTLYTLGVSFTGNNIALVNAKMMMYMQDNKETRKLKVQDRIFIGNHVYTVMFMDTVSRKGLINYLLEQDTISEAYDNQELRIADYYKKKNEEAPVEPETEDVEVEVLGDEKVRIGKTYIYSVKGNSKVEEWSVESIDGTDLPFVIQERDDKKLTIRVKDDSRLVGSKATVILKLSNGSYISKVIKVISRF